MPLLLIVLACTMPSHSAAATVAGGVPETSVTTLAAAYANARDDSGYTRPALPAGYCFL